MNYCQLAVISVDSPEVTAAFRAGVGATFTDERRAIRELDIVKQTAPGFEHGVFCMQSWSYQ